MAKRHAFRDVTKIGNGERETENQKVGTGTGHREPGTGTGALERMYSGNLPDDSK